MPAAHGPISAATCGITPLAMTSSRNRWPEPANSEPAASWMRAPAESSSQTIGMRFCSASSRSRPTLSSPVMPIEPAMTVKSYAAIGAQAPVDLAVAGDHAVGRRLLALHRPLGEVRPAVDAQLDEGALVDQQLEPLARGELVLLVLALDLLLAAALPGLLAPLVQIVDERPQGRSRDELIC